MSKAVEFDLLSLVPGITLPVPPKLVNLSVSLLAQSRSKASSLKPEEESARGYVCAHIACERLKQSLDLPKIVPRPSLPPRPYKKLYDYIDSVLARKPNKQTESAPSTPSKPRPTSAHITPGKATPSKGTPREATTPSKNRTPQAPSTKRSRAFKNGSAAEDVPGWITPAIRTVCKALKKPNATPHVYVGVSSILKVLQEQAAEASAPPKKRRRSSAEAHAATTSISFDADTQIPALIAVIAIHTINALSSTSPTPAEYKALRTQIVKTLLKCIPDDMVSTEEDMISDIERFLREADSGDWLQMEWYVNLQSQARGEEADDQREEDEREEWEAQRGDGAKRGGRRSRQSGDVSAATFQRRAFGGMMTPQTNYLSEENVIGYGEWREYIETLMR